MKCRSARGRGGCMKLLRLVVTQCFSLVHMPHLSLPSIIVIPAQCVRSGRAPSMQVMCMKHHVQQLTSDARWTRRAG